MDQLGLPTSPTKEEIAMGYDPKKVISELEQWVAELSAEIVRWQQRALIAEENEVRLDRELRVEKAFRLDAERSLRAYRAKSVRGLWARLWGRA